MTLNVIVSETRLKVYQLITQGICQIEISKILKIKKPTVNVHVKSLLEEEFIELDTSKKSAVKVYRKGRKSNALDRIILAREVSTMKEASGNENVRPIGVEGGKVQGYRVVQYNVHHITFKRSVSKQGDSNFFTSVSHLNNNVSVYIGGIPSSEITYKNTRRLLGYVPRKDEKEITIRMYDSISCDKEGKETEKLTLYVHAPSLLLTEKELDHYNEISKEICRDVFDCLERRHGWHYNSEIESTNWDVHVAVDEPELQGLAKYATVYSDDKVLTSSNSNGVAEIESVGQDNVKAVKAYVNLPARMDKTEQNQKAHLNYLNMLKSEQDALSEMMYAHQQAFLEFIELDTKRLKIMSRNISQNIENVDPLSSDNSKGMYQ